MITIRPQLFSEGNWIIPALSCFAALVVLSKNTGTQSLIIVGFLLILQIVFIGLLLYGTSFKVKDNTFYFSYFFYQQTKIPISEISKIVWRGTFRFSKSRFPKFDVYASDKKCAFTINPKPFSQKQCAELFRTMLQINTKIELDPKLKELLEKY